MAYEARVCMVDSLDALSFLARKLSPGLPGPVDSADLRLTVRGLGIVGDVTNEPPEKVAIRLDPFGGCGKDAMLTVFLMLRSGLLSFLGTVEVDLNVGMDGEEVVCCGFRATAGMVDLDGVRVASFDGICETEGVLGRCDGAGRLLRVLIVGRGGNAEFGGSNRGCEGLVMTVAMLQTPILTRRPKTLHDVGKHPTKSRDYGRHDL